MGLVRHDARDHESGALYADDAAQTGFARSPGDHHGAFPQVIGPTVTDDLTNLLY